MQPFLPYPTPEKDFKNSPLDNNLKYGGAQEVKIGAYYETPVSNKKVSKGSQIVCSDENYTLTLPLKEIVHKPSSSIDFREKFQSIKHNLSPLLKKDNEEEHEIYKKVGLINKSSGHLSVFNKTLLSKPLSDEKTLKIPVSSKYLATEKNIKLLSENALYPNIKVTCFLCSSLS
jgi:hypothetical protein